MNKKQKSLAKIFIFIWIFTSISINWNHVSWIFNRRVASSLVYDFFNPYQEAALLVSASEQINYVDIQKQKEYPYTQKNNSIEIPSIGIVAPIVVAQSTDKQVLVKNLDNGVVYYPGSVEPGKNGQMTILGHSAPPGWPKIKYDWVFSDINNLNPEDIIIINFNNREYTYKVKNKVIVNPGEDVKSADADKNNILTIVSCWPPGKDYRRIAVQAKLMQ